MPDSADDTCVLWNIVVAITIMLVLTVNVTYFIPLAGAYAARWRRCPGSTSGRSTGSRTNGSVTLTVEHVTIFAYRSSSIPLISTC